MKKDVIYIDSRESSRITRFKNFISENTLRNKKNNSLLLKDGKKQIKVSGKNYSLLYEDIIVSDLPVGDFMQNGVFFEFKRDDDLIDSIRSDRLDKQIDNFHVNYSDKYYFNVISPNKNKLTFNEINYFANELDIPFIQLDNEKECFKYILNSWANYQKTSRRYSLNKRFKGNGYQHILNLCAGHNYSTSIFNKYPGFKTTDALNLSVNKLCKIKGIGNTRAEEIMNKIKLYV